MNFFCISIKQPWPWAILELNKNIENRSWPLPLKCQNIPILMHTGKEPDRDAIKAFKRNGYLVPDNLPLGGICGLIMFSGENKISSWAEEGLFNWHIIEKCPLPFHPLRGELKFFKARYSIVTLLKTPGIPPAIMDYISQRTNPADFI